KGTEVDSHPGGGARFRRRAPGSPGRLEELRSKGVTMATTEGGGQSMISPGEAREQAMISERVAPALVARTLGPFDLVVIFVAIVLFIFNSAAVQAAGPSFFIFLIISFSILFIYCGL